MLDCHAKPLYNSAYIKIEQVGESDKPFKTLFITTDGTIKFESGYNEKIVIDKATFNILISFIQSNDTNKRFDKYTNYGFTCFELSILGNKKLKTKYIVNSPSNCKKFFNKLMQHISNSSSNQQLINELKVIILRIG